MIEIKNISKSFKDKQVLFDISGKFEKGRTNLIIGASGTGKSVLLKCLVGLLEPDVGSVLFDGRDFSSTNKKLTTEIKSSKELNNEQKINLLLKIIKSLQKHLHKFFLDLFL